MPCPKCNGILVIDEGVVFCEQCLHILNKEERDLYYGRKKTVETTQIPKEEIHKIKIQKRISKKVERKKASVEELSDSYIRRTLKTRNKRNPVDITPEEIEKRRQKILAFREKQMRKTLVAKIDKINMRARNMHA